MSRDLSAQPSARTFPLAHLVDLVRQGKVRVPPFQRGLRWQTSDAVSLLDSVVRGFPIGSLLLWSHEAEAAAVRLGGVTIDAPRLTEAFYVVDGQQRITTFLNVFHREGGDSRFALVYDLRSRQVRASRPNDSPEHVIPLPVLFELKEVLRWVKDHPGYTDRIDEINGVTQRLREFHVPAYVVSSQDEDVLRQIYDRMNSSGKRLTRAEVFRGLFSAREPDSEQVDLGLIATEVRDRLEWGLPDLDTVLQAFMARRGPDVYRDIHHEFDDASDDDSEFSGESQQQAQRRALEALEKTIRFLQDPVGVPHFSFLPYRYLLIVLTRFFAHFPDPASRNQDLLVRWFWTAARTGPYQVAGSTTGAIKALASGIVSGQENESVQRLLDRMRGKQRLDLSPSRFRASTAAGRIMLCALWAQQGKSPDTEQPFDRADLALELGEDASPSRACPEMVPRAELRDELRPSLGNRVIMPGIPIEMVREPQRWSEDVRRSHLLGDESDPNEMVQQRETRMYQVVSDFLMSKTQEGLDASAPLESYDFDDEDDARED
ncbi:MAG: DUF262 domain-containing protein [Actinomycetia bacterium]|nr:DUF262 domain-containing protein [Actinomycetes bacterium]